MAKSKPVKKGKKKKSVTVSMSGVESGGRSIEDGWAHGRIKEAELGTSSNDNEMFKLKWEVTRGKEKATVFDQLVLTPSALWKTKTLLEACGVEVPDDDMDLNEEMFVDLECDVEILNEEYEDKIRPRINGFRPAGDEEDEDEEEDDDEEEERPKSKSRGDVKKSKKSDDEDDDEDEEDDDEEDDDSDDDDDEEDDDDDDEPPPKKKKKSKPIEDDEDEDEDDEDDEDDDEDEDEDDDEEEEAPKKKSKKAKKKLRAGMKVKFKDDKGKAKSGVITSIDDDTIYVEDSKQTEWELEESEIELV